MSKRFLFLDFETYSETDIGKCGSYKYMEDPNFGVLLLAYGFNDKPIDVVDFAQGETWPSDFLSALRDPEVIKVAHNASFERYAIWRSLGFYCDPKQWFDTMHLCGVCGLPMSLAGAGDALGLGEDQAKMKEGKALIRYFCLPCKPTKTNGMRTRNLPEHAPDKWLTFKEYCRRDVETERTIFNLLKRWAPDATEKRFWNLDTRINERGVRIDRQMAINAMAMDLKYKEELTERAVEITGLENPKSVSQIKNWLYDQEGKEFPSLNKKVIADVVSQLETEEAREFMALRAELSKSSVAKYDAMVRSQCEDGTVKGCFLFYGASRTGRFAGRLVQFQNLPQNHMDTLAEARSLVKGGHYTAMKALYGSVTGPLSELIRTAIIPEDGHQLLVSDFAAIEARVTAWFAQEKWRLDVFESGGDIYCASASQMFHVPVVKHGENGHLRQKGKVAELALGYGGGVNALKAFGADKMGMTEQEMQETVDLWRESSPGVVAMWKDLEKAAIRAVARRGTVVCNLPGADVRFDYEDGILWMGLPSGRRIAYYGARYEPSRYDPTRKVLSYMGTDQKTKKWTRLETWGGKLTENCWAAGTPVLTDRGWTPIENVTSEMKVWDGEEWVSNDGSECQSREEVLFELDGLLVTGDHKILTSEGWKNAKECEGLDRLLVQLPEDFGPWGDEGLPRAKEMGCPMRMRTSLGDGPQRHIGAAESRAPDFLRVQKERTNFKSEFDARNVRSHGLRRLALDDTALYRADARGLEKLRWTRYHGVREMASQLRELLGRYGADLRKRFGFGSEEQRVGLLAGKLPLDNENRELPKQAWGATGDLHGSGNAAEGNGRADGDRVHNAAVQAGPRLSVREASRRSGHGQPVYDVMNCGPRHRYVVLGNTGPIIAHNCVQATARDCLRESMLALDEAGYDIRAHVHDEVIVTEPVDGRSVEDMSAIMGRPIAWAPGLPLRADGYSCPFYQKD